MTKRLSFEYFNANAKPKVVAEDTAALANFLAEATDAICKPDGIRKHAAMIQENDQALKDGSLKFLMAKMNHKIIGCLMFRDINNLITVTGLHTADIGTEKEARLESIFETQLDMYAHKENGKTIAGVSDKAQKPNFQKIFSSIVPVLNMGK